MCHVKIIPCHTDVTNSSVICDIPLYIIATACIVCTLDETEAFEKEWDHKVHAYNNNMGMMLGGHHHRRSLNQPALAFKPHHSEDYQQPTSMRHKEKRHRQEHRDNDDDKYADFELAGRTKPRHSRIDRDTQHHNVPIELDPDSHHHQHDKSKSLRASKRKEMDPDPGHQQSRPMAPGIGHRSKLSKNVNFPDDTHDDRPVRKESHHYSKYARDNGRHSTKRSTTDHYSEML